MGITSRMEDQRQNPVTHGGRDCYHSDDDMLGDGSPRRNQALHPGFVEAGVQDERLAPADVRYRVCFVSSVTYSRPLDETSAKKYRALGVLGAMFVIGFAPGLRPAGFEQGARFHLLPSVPTPALRYAFLYSFGVVLILLSIFHHGVSLVVAQSPYEGFAGAIAKRLAGLLGHRVALVVESHGDFETAPFLQRRLKLPGIYRRLMARISRFALNHADALRGVSSSTESQLSRWAPGKPVVSFPAWTDIDTFLAAFGSESRDSQAVLFVGVLIPTKAVDLLIEAFGRMADRAPRARLVIAGGKPDRAYFRSLQDRVTRMDLGSRVEFLTDLPQFDLAREMARAAVLVLPSLSEGLGRVVFEAMACGTPVIASRVGGIVDLVVDGETGLLVPPGDVEALAERITWVLAHPEEAREMGRRARKFAQGFYSTQSYVDGYRSSFELALDAAGIGRSDSP